MGWTRQSRHSWIRTVIVQNLITGKRRLRSCGNCSNKSTSNIPSLRILTFLDRPHHQHLPAMFISGLEQQTGAWSNKRGLGTANWLRGIVGLPSIMYQPEHGEGRVGETAASKLGGVGCLRRGWRWQWRCIQEVLIFSHRTRGPIWTACIMLKVHVHCACPSPFNKQPFHLPRECRGSTRTKRLTQ